METLWPSTSDRFLRLCMRKRYSSHRAFPRRTTLLTGYCELCLAKQWLGWSTRQNACVSVPACESCYRWTIWTLFSVRFFLLPKSCYHSTDGKNVSIILQPN